jgi:AraC-like DNA-binding protein
MISLKDDKIVLIKFTKDSPETPVPAFPQKNFYNEFFRISDRGQTMIDKLPDENLKVLYSHLSGITAAPMYYKVIPQFRYKLVKMYKSLNFNNIHNTANIIMINFFVKIYTILMYLHNSFRNKNQITSVNRQIYEYTKHFIEENFTTDFSISDITSGQPYSSDTIRRLFTRYHNDSIFAYRNELRIEIAKWLLKEKELKVVDIAVKCGFNELSSFNKIFKRLTGKSPKNYQKANESTD